VLKAGEQVTFRFEKPPGKQDGCDYRATAVWCEE
jgi:hypothetical protein